MFCVERRGRIKRIKRKMKGKEKKERKAKEKRRKKCLVLWLEKNKKIFFSFLFI